MYYSHSFCSMEKVHLKPYNTFIIMMLENPFSSFVHRSSMVLIQSLVTLFLIHNLTRVIHLRWIVFDSLKRTNSEFALFRAIDSVAVLMYNCAGTQTSGHIQIHCLVLFLWRQHRCIAYCLWFPTILCVSLAVGGTNENGIWWKSWNNSWMSFFQRDSISSEK